MLAMDDFSTETKTEITSKSVDVIVSFKNILITGDLHKYSLLFGLTLNTPPAKTGFLARLYIPSFVSVPAHRDFTEIKSIERDKVKYTEFSFDSKQKVYPGDTVEIVAPEGRAQLEYQFNHNIWYKVDEGNYCLMWEIYFNDQMPVKGSKDLKDLNVF